MTRKNVQVNIIEVKRPELDAVLVAHNITALRPGWLDTVEQEAWQRLQPAQLRQRCRQRQDRHRPHPLDAVQQLALPVEVIVDVALHFAVDLLDLLVQQARFNPAVTAAARAPLLQARAPAAAMAFAESYSLFVPGKAGMITLGLATFIAGKLRVFDSKENVLTGCFSFCPASSH